MYWMVFSFLLLSDFKVFGFVFFKMYLNMIGRFFNIFFVKLIFGCVIFLRYVVFLDFGKIFGFLFVLGLKFMILFVKYVFELKM